MTPELFLDTALLPALRMFPTRMDGPEARAMILAICLQESGLKHRQQIVKHNPPQYGPARSYAQFERIGVQGVVEHPTSGPVAELVCARIDVPFNTDYIYAAIGYSDVLACVMARSLLWRHPQKLPSRDNSDRGWSQYMALWKPGKPHGDVWAEHFRKAWEVTVKE